jgi:hypothetical protein
MAELATPIYKQPVFFAIAGILVVLFSAIVISIVITTGGNKGSSSITLNYEFDIKNLSKKDVEDLANEYLLPTLRRQAAGKQVNLTWECNEKGIRVVAVADGRTISNLKKIDSIIKIEMPAYLIVKEVAQRQKSGKKLQRLKDMLVKYAVSNNEKYPITLDELKQYDSESLLPWLHENIEYLGKGKTRNDPPDIAIAYDKRLLEKGKGTNVLFNHHLVNFVRPNELEKLGIIITKK